MHAMPGRVRLKIERLGRNPELAREVHKRVSKVRGVHQVEVNPSSASLVVHYRPNELSAAEFLTTIFESLGLLFPEIEVEELAALELKELAEIWISETGEGAGTELGVLAAFALAGIGLREAAASHSFPLPTWSDLFWFALGMFVALQLSARSAVAPARA